MPASQFRISLGRIDGVPKKSELVRNMPKQTNLFMRNHMGLHTSLYEQNGYLSDDPLSRSRASYCQHELNDCNQRSARNYECNNYTCVKSQSSFWGVAWVTQLVHLRPLRRSNRARSLLCNSLRGPPSPRARAERCRIRSILEGGREGRLVGTSRASCLFIKPCSQN